MGFLLNTYLFLTESKDIMVGSFIGSNVKPNKVDNYGAEIRKGILSNHLITNFKRSHLSYLASQKRLSPKFSKYTEDVVDLLYDHLLASTWKERNEYPFVDFIQNLYQDLLEFHSVFPYKMNRLLPFIISNNLFGLLETMNGVHKYIKLMAKRDTLKGNFEYAITDFLENYVEFRNDFKVVLNDLSDFVQTDCKKNLEEIFQGNTPQFIKTYK
ncbi:ACP phosphodiesterase [Sporocytophaga myxococcoides]|uniref:ACP phosphodiesterase n=1 Tax=Sporocytophaga myxococcoides TaxID=153721 RepID=UPI00048BEA42|nr:ACP phosphodiesterase [Sporocytophaga myxococcoides]